MLPKCVNRRGTGESSILVYDDDMMQPGRGCVHAIGSELRQLLHEILGDDAIQKCEGF